MLHPSTQQLIVKLHELTAKGELEWREGERQTSVFETEGYLIEVEAEPPMVRVLTSQGRELERAGGNELSAEPWPGGTGDFGGHVAEMARSAHRVARGAEKAIATILSALSAPKAKSEAPKPAPSVAPQLTAVAESAASQATMEADRVAARPAPPPQAPPKPQPQPVAALAPVPAPAPAPPTPKPTFGAIASFAKPPAPKTTAQQQQKTQAAAPPRAMGFSAVSRQTVNAEPDAPARPAGSPEGYKPLR